LGRKNWRARKAGRAARKMLLDGDMAALFGVLFRRDWWLGGAVYIRRRWLRGGLRSSAGTRRQFRELKRLRMMG
jgi:hypothetical protein